MFLKRGKCLAVMDLVTSWLYLRFQYCSVAAPVVLIISTPKCVKISTILRDFVHFSPILGQNKYIATYVQYF